MDMDQHKKLSEDKGVCYMCTHGLDMHCFAEPLYEEFTGECIEPTDYDYDEEEYLNLCMCDEYSIKNPNTN